MPVQLVNQSPRYGKAHLIEPAPLGYLQLAADVEAPHWPGPVLHRSRDKQQLFGVLKWQARRLAELEAVQTVTVYDALGFTPPGGDVQGQAARLVPARFDVVILVETVSPDAARDVRATQAYQELAGTLTERARRVHQIAARNVRRVGDVDKSRPGLFVFNYLVGDDPGLATELWEYLSGWYAAETGLGSATLLAPLEGEQSDYVLINHARWDGSLPAFAARQLPKRTFRSYLLANLKANHVAAMPVLYRLALPGPRLACQSMLDIVSSRKIGKGGMAMAATVHEAQQEEFLSTLRKGQEIALDALKALVETIQFVTPPVPVIHVPTAHEVVAVGNQLAEQLLANQRQFADEVIAVLSPLLPGKAGKTAAESGERKPAAAGKAGKPAAA